MPTAVKSKTISIQIISSNITTNTPVYILNRNTGDRWTVFTTAGTNADEQFALCSLINNNDDGNTPTAWDKTHVIEVQVVGYGFGSGTISLTKEDPEITISTITQDTGAAISV